MTRAILIALLALFVLWAGHTLAPLMGLRIDAPRPPPSSPRLHTGDQGGAQPANVPNPPDSRRLYSLVSPEDPPKITQRYTSELSAPAVAAYYRQVMPGHGWKERRRVSGRSENYPGILLWYSNSAGNWCMIGISDLEQGGSAVTVMSIPAVTVERPSPSR